MNTINEYYENVRRDIAKEFGLEAGGYAPIPAPALSTSQALYLNNKYPSADPLDMKPSAKAVLIAKRYASLKKAWSN